MTKARVLLVEDEPFIREVLAEVLLEADLEVTEAGDGGEALALLNGQDGFDLLLTDVHMPGCIDGVAVALHARALQPRLAVLWNVRLELRQPLRTGIEILQQLLEASRSSGACFWRNIPRSTAVQSCTVRRLAPATVRFTISPALHMEPRRCGA